MERFMEKHGDYLWIVPAPARMSPDQDIAPESFMVLMTLVRRMASFVVLDVPHQWARWVSSVLLDANEVVITACPDLTNLRDAKNIFDTLGPQRGVDSPTRLVLNKQGASKRTELTAKNFQEALNVSPTAVMTFAPAIFGRSLNDGVIVAELDKGGRNTKELSKLVTVVSARGVQAKAKTGKRRRPVLSFLKLKSAS